MNKEIIESQLENLKVVKTLLDKVEKNVLDSTNMHDINTVLSIYNENFINLRNAVSALEQGIRNSLLSILK